jgi:glycosyltransferase involved in cell wall biosynthesis
MPVYQPIIPYLQRLGVTRYQVCYNVLDGGNLRAKENCAIQGPPRIISVGRLFEDKNPEQMIRAVHGIPTAQLTIVGDGPQRPALEALVRELRLAERVRFRPAVDNAELCRELADYDLFAIHTEYWELNKSLLEALLTGLPVVINRRIGLPVPELEDSIVFKVNNTADDYRAAFERLIGDDALREELGRRAYRHAQEHWAPRRTEAVYADIYRRLALS